jgi:hypothetical protein
VAAKSAGNSSFVNSQWPTHSSMCVSLHMKRVNYDTRTHNVRAKLAIILLHSNILYWRYHYAAAVHAAISLSRVITCCTEPSHLRVIDKDMQLTLLPDRIVSETSVETPENGTNERNSSADLRTAVKSARSSCKKMASLPVSFFRSAIAAFALVAVRAAR